MTAVVRNTAQLPADDRNAMAAYVKSLPPVEGPKRPEKKTGAPKVQRLSADSACRCGRFRAEPERAPIPQA